MPDKLRRLQLRFQDYLTGKSEDFEQDIVSTADALAEHRLGAYYNAYRIRLIESLATDFPALQKTLGEAAFEYLVLDYLKMYPSEHPSVRWAGRHMAEFLQHSNLENRGFLAELANFEWNQGLCFDAPDCDRLCSEQDMAEVPPTSWPVLRFEFHRSIRWLDLHWNIPPIWVARDDDTSTPEPTRESIPTRWLMWRKELSPHWRSLDVGEAWAIQAALNGANFAELCEGLLEWYDADTVAMAAAGYLKQWIHDGLITGIQMDH